MGQKRSSEKAEEDFRSSEGAEDDVTWAIARCKTLHNGTCNTGRKSQLTEDQKPKEQKKIFGLPKIPKMELEGSMLGAEHFMVSVSVATLNSRGLLKKKFGMLCQPKTKRAKTENRKPKNQKHQRQKNQKHKIRRWCRSDSVNEKFLVYRRHTLPNGVGTEENWGFSANRKSQRFSVHQK